MNGSILHRNTLKGAWEIKNREAFERKLQNAGWTPGYDGYDSLFKKDKLAIRVDDHGVFIYQNGIRYYGLCDALCDAMVRHYLGPLARHPFSKNKHYRWLDLQEGQFLRVRSV